jgi:hypothetical protein
VPISERGNVTIVSRVALPASCQTPAVLIEPHGSTTIYIATSGFGG